MMITTRTPDAPAEEAPKTDTIPQSATAEHKKPSEHKVDSSLQHFAINPKLIETRKTHLDLPVAASALYQLWAGPQQPLLQITKRTHKTSLEVTLCYSLPKETSKHNQTFFESDLNQFKGLATISLIASVLGQERFDPELLGFNTKYHCFLNLHFEEAFHHCWMPRDKVTKAEIESNEILIPVEPFLVVDGETAKITNNISALQAKQKSLAYLAEQREALFFILFTPDSLILRILEANCKNAIAVEGAYKDILAQKKAWQFRAFTNSVFRDMLFKDGATLAAKLTERCKEFITHHHSVAQKVKPDQIADEIKLSVGNVSTQERLENSILEDKELSPAQKKELIKHIKIHQIKEQKEKKEIYKIVNDLFTEEKYKPIRDRTGDITTADMKGNHYKDTPVSNTFSEIYEVGKKTVLCNALRKMLDGDSKDIKEIKANKEERDFVCAQRHSSWMGSAPLFGMLAKKVATMFQSTCERMLAESESADKSRTNLQELEQGLRM
jgi:hypothetical protein